VQKRCCVGQEEDAVFTQISADVNTYRDAVVFHNGCQVRRQAASKLVFIGAKKCVL